MYARDVASGTTFYHGTQSDLKVRGLILSTL
jgi:hypothetical protein